MNKKVAFVIYAICVVLLVADCVISAINADIQGCIRDVLMCVLAVAWLFLDRADKKSKNKE